MVWTLFKKDLTAMFSGFLFSRKTGKRRSTGSLIAYIALFVLLFISLGFAFFGYAAILGDSIGTNNWLYMSLIGCFGLAFALLGSVFQTYSTLFKAKDNELMLSLPIPQGKLLLSRMCTVYLMALLFCVLGSLPGLIFAWIDGMVPAVSVPLSILTIFFNALIASALSCVLGWLVALIVGLFPNKNAATVIFTLGFLVIYYTFYFKIQSAIQSMAMHYDQVETGIKGYAYPIYKMGQGALGDITAFLIYAGICLAVFAVVYFVLSRSINRILTKTDKQRTKVYVEKKAHASSAPTALLRKEFRGLLGNATYMLNCALGSILFPVGAAFVLIKMTAIREFIADLVFQGGAFLLNFLPLLIAAAVCFAATMNDLTAPSISLEAKTLWLLKSLPVDTNQVFYAKKMLHNILTIIPAMILHVALCIATQLPLRESVETAVLEILFILFMSSAGLALNLKMPNLNWTNIAVAVKQSGSVLIALFGGWVILGGLAALYGLWLVKYIDPQKFLYALIAFFMILTILVNIWLRKRGTKVFEDL